VNEINKIFNNSYKSALSVIVLDDIERLIEFIHIGPRFSNPVLQALLVLIKKVPPYKNRRLLIIGTTSMSHILEELEVLEVFNVEHSLPIINKKEDILRTLEKYEGEESEKELIAESIQTIPIKYLLLTLQMTLQKGDGVLTHSVFQQCLKDVMK
jgi:vesicle-fusing ATPase